MSTAPGSPTIEYEALDRIRIRTYQWYRDAIKLEGRRDHRLVQLGTAVIDVEVDVRPSRPVPSSIHRTSNHPYAVTPQEHSPNRTHTTNPSKGTGESTNPARRPNRLPPSPILTRIPVKHPNLNRRHPCHPQPYPTPTPAITQRRIIRRSRNTRRRHSRIANVKLMYDQPDRFPAASTERATTAYAVDAAGTPPNRTHTTNPSKEPGESTNPAQTAGPGTIATIPILTRIPVKSHPNLNRRHPVSSPAVPDTNTGLPNVA